MLPLLLLVTRAVLAIKITGAGGSGDNNANAPQPFRYEINNFCQSGPAWDLYIQALSAIQSRDQVRTCPRAPVRLAANLLQSDPMSYFQIAGTRHLPATMQQLTTEGIHGYPHIAWDGVSGNGTYAGFCMHSDQLFPSWHRPYLALFEVRRTILRPQHCSSGA